ncbi:hypothetical protein [Actinacidiphila acididurans]|uniref:hypothetical protein n=1 Tax=Actinacidiphila acididurans TaxID=2784346 RepID=UPI001F36D8C4|nr:hypothetical protein [Actinacidiphila acididurans]
MLPAYLERDHDRRLRDHLLDAARGERTTLVLVRGSSCTGKTRTAFEAVRVCLPDWRLVRPKTPEGLLALLDAGLLPRTVLWLDEAQNHLRGTDGEEAAAALHRRLEDPGPVVILGTLWPEYHRDLTATPHRGRAATKDPHVNARALLAQAVLVDVPASFATESLRVPLVHRDPALATAALTSTGGKIAQTLAAGPQLVDHYEQATAPHGPYGRAVITAALDARRLGHASPLPAALLEAAAPGYLTAEQRAAADPGTWFARALDYARETVRGVAAALEPVADPDGMGPLPGVHQLSDYLHHHARTARRYVFPPESFWIAVRDLAAGAADLYGLADAARVRGRRRIADELYRRAADAGEPEALAALAKSREEVGDGEGAERYARLTADAGAPGFLTVLAQNRAERGDAQGAERLYRLAADAGEPYALLQLAQECEEVGDAEGADRFARRAADAGEPFVLMVLASMGSLRTRAGDAEGAERLFRLAADGGEPGALAEMAWLRLEAGDTEGARQYARLTARADGPWARMSPWYYDGESADGEEQARYAREAADAGAPRSLRTKAEERERAGDPEGAERFARLAADVGAPGVLDALASARERAGDTEGAELLWQRAAEAGHPAAQQKLARLRANADDAEAAERFSWAPSDPAHILVGLTALVMDNAGLREPDLSDTFRVRQLHELDPDVRDDVLSTELATLIVELAGLREWAREAERAERLCRLAADAGSTFLMKLATLRAEIGDAASAEQLYRLAADAGEHRALVPLARLREKAGDAAHAEQLYRRATDAGEHRVLANLADERWRAGDTASAERLYRLIADTGDSHALTMLMHLRKQAGDMVGAQRFAEQAGSLLLLAELREKAGDAAHAERLYQLAADGGTTEWDALARLRAKAGDVEGAQQLRRFGLEVDGSPARPW